MCNARNISVGSVQGDGWLTIKHFVYWLIAYCCSCSSYLDNECSDLDPLVLKVEMKLGFTYKISSKTKINPNLQAVTFHIFASSTKFHTILPIVMYTKAFVNNGATRMRMNQAA
jgi:hypothetical protein